MASINDLKLLVELESNKPQNGQFSVAGFNTAAKAAVFWYFNDCYGQPMLSQNGNTANDMKWQSGKKISDNLRQLLKLVDLPVNNKGWAARPADFVHTSSIRFCYKTIVTPKTDTTKAVIKTNEVQVVEISDDEISERLDGELLAPTLEYPVCAIYDTYLQLYPKNVGNLKFTYLRKPRAPIWAYTMQPSTAPVNQQRPKYDPITSVDVDFPDECLNEIAVRICSIMGINISNPMLIQYAQNMKSQGV